VSVGGSIALIVVGAVLYYAVTAEIPVIDLQARREDLGNDKTTRTLTAELKRRFADEGAVHSG
jgi:hypothetical protein